VAELPTSDPEGKIDISSLIARARSEADVVALSPVGARPTEVLSPEEPRMLRHRTRRAVLAIAALALLASVTVRLLGVGDFGGSYSTGIGEQRTIQLADGSTIEVNARSRVACISPISSAT